MDASRTTRLQETLNNDPEFQLTSLQIHAPADRWNKFLELVPKPFYLDLWGASV